MRREIALSIALLAAFLLSAAYADTSKLRVANAIFNSDPLEVRSGNDTLFESVPYKNFTDYVDVPAGHPMEIVIMNHGVAILNATITPEDNHAVTLAAVGVIGNTTEVFRRILADDLKAPTAITKARVRFFHASYDTPKVDVKLDSTEIANDVGFQDVSDYKEIANGIYIMSVSSHGVNAVFFTTPVVIDGSDVYTIALEGLMETKELSGVAAVDMAYQFFQARAAHAAPEEKEVDFVMMDANNKTTTLASKLAYKGFGDYMILPASDYTLVVLKAGTQDVIGTYHVGTFNQYEIATIAFTGNENSSAPLTAVAFQDQNDPPADSTVGAVKFVNLFNGLGAVDIVVDGQTIFSNVGYLSQSDYMHDVPADTYHVEIVRHGTNDTAISTDVTVTGGVVSAVYGEGPVDTLSVVTNEAAKFSYFHLRTSHASPNCPAVDIYASFGSKSYPLFTKVQPGDVTYYLNLPIFDDLTIVLTKSDTTDILLSMEPSAPAAGAVETLLIYGLLPEGNNTNAMTPLSVAFLEDHIAAPASGQQTDLRLVNAIPGAVVVDLVANGQVVFTSVAYGAASAYKALDAGTYQIKVNYAGGNFSVLSTTLTLDGGKVYTLFAEGVENNTKAVLSVDAAYNFTTLRVSQAVYQAPAVDIVLDDGSKSTVAFSNVAFGQTTDYKAFVLENYTFKVTKAGDQSQVLFTGQPTLEADMIYTILAAGSMTGNSSHPGLYALTDDNVAPRSSMQARVRFVNAAPGVSSVSVRLNDVEVFSDVEYSTASEYKVIQAQSYRLDVYTSDNSTQSIYTKTDLKIEGGQVYTIILEGVMTALSSEVVSDASYQYFQVRVTHAVAMVDEISVKIDGTVAFANINFTQTTDFEEYLAGKKKVEVVSGAQTLLSEDITFETGKDSTLLVVGVGGENSSHPVEGVILVNDWTMPSSDTKTSIRFIQAAPGTMGVNVAFNGTEHFKNVTYTKATAYTEMDAGEYQVDFSGNHVNLTATFNLVGGAVYSLYLDGLPDGVPGLVAVLAEDYFPPPDFKLRVFQAAPEVKAVDVLNQGAAVFMEVDFEGASEYKTFREGAYKFRFVPAGQLGPIIYDTPDLTFDAKHTYSLFLVGLEHSNDSNLESVVFEDDNTLPAAGKINVRLINVSPDTMAVNLKTDDTELFSNITYKGVSEYKTIDAKTYTINLLTTSDSKSLFSQQMDLQVPQDGSAVYTLVVEGLSHGEPSLKVVSFLDAGSPPPPQPSEPGKKKDKGLMIGLIVGGCVLAIIILAAIGFVVYRKRRARAGYEAIPAHE